MSDNARPRSAAWQPVVIFYDSDLPHMATHVAQAACGSSLYKGILIQWDEDWDTRVLQLVDSLSAPVREQLLIVQEHEGGIAFVWDYIIPDGYEEGGGVDVAGDSWEILSSRALRTDPDLGAVP